jgi:indole-3-glycerol phosphate synthase
LRLSEAIRAASVEGRIPVIAEIKVRTPRDGDLLRDRDPISLAMEMEEAGATAVSVVTETKYFGGDLQMLQDISQRISLPILRKDFIETKEQVYESKESGASALLLISSMIPLETIEELGALSERSGMETVIEVHNERELGAVSRLDPEIIGINNRDISRLETGSGDVSRTELLAPLAPDSCLLISESSIMSRNDARRAMDAGADAILVGTALMKSPSITRKLQELILP